MPNPSGSPALPTSRPVAEMSDADASRMAARVAKHGLELHVIAAGAPFKQLHLDDLDLDTMQDDPAFRKEFDDLVRSMQIAVHLGIKTVNTFTFAWPGEYSAAKPNLADALAHARRGHRRGGHGEAAQGVLPGRRAGRALRRGRIALHDAVELQPIPPATSGGWSSVSAHRASRSCGGRPTASTAGRADVATAGYRNERPHIHGLHIKDLHVNNGVQLDFEYRPLGTGDVDYLTILRQLHADRSDAILAVATHFRPPSGSREEAMRTNYAQLKQLISRV